MFRAFRKYFKQGFWRQLAINSFSAIGVLAVFIELANNVSMKFPISGWLLTWTIAIISIGYGAIASWPRMIRQQYKAPSTSIEVVKGDLFDQDCPIVIGMTDTFDISFPVISENSIQGQLLTRIYDGKTKKLDKDIFESLKSAHSSGSVKKLGKTIRYPIGTVATINKNSKNYYLLAYSHMNIHNQAQSSTDDIWHSLSMLWQEISRSANGNPLAIPVIGGGLSRISQVLPAQDSIRLIAMSFIFASRKQKISEALRIIVEPEVYDQLNLYELQLFLSSLRRL